MVRSVMGRCARCATAVLLPTLFMGGSAAGETLTFDDLFDPELYYDIPETAWPDSSPIPNGYGGLNWVDMWYVDATKVESDGYWAGRTSGDYVAFNAEAKVASTSSTPFFLNSAYFTAAHLNELRLEVEGYAGGILVGSQTRTINKNAPTLITFNWTVDQVTFAGFDSLGSSKNWFAMDDLTINALPLPAAAWGGMALMGFIGAKRARRSP